MLHFLGFIFFIILAILLIGLGIIASFVLKVFNLNRQTSSNKPSQNSAEEWTPTEEGELHTNRKKIFTKDEGEYVDYEEINSAE